MKSKKAKKKLKKMRRKQLQIQQAEESPIKNESESQHNNIGSGRKGSFQEPKDVPKTPPIVSGSRKRVRCIVEFVYPKDSSNESKKYVFDKQRETVQSSPGSWEAHGQLVYRGEKRSTVISESIDDILFSKGKKRREEPSAEEATPEEEDNRKGKGPSIAPLSQTVDTSNDEATEGGRLSGLSVEDAVRDRAGCRPRANSTDGELNLPRRGLCDERMVLESHKWKNSIEHTPPKGFTNLGNTCFLNATLQCLAYLPMFAQTLTSLPTPPAGGINGRKLTKGQRMTAMLSALFRQVHNINGAKTGGEHAISPHGIVRAVPTLGSGGSRCGYKFRPGQQEDAHEFLVHLLDAMQDGELKAAGKHFESAVYRVSCNADFHYWLPYSQCAQV